MYWVYAGMFWTVLVDICIECMLACEDETTYVSRFEFYFDLTRSM